MAESKNENREMGKYRLVLIDRDDWAGVPHPDLIVARCTRHYKGPKTDEILGSFSWDNWEASTYCYNMEIARIVSEVIQNKSWSSLDELSALYSEALKIMANDKHRPYVYAMTFKGNWLKEVHNVDF